MLATRLKRYSPWLKGTASVIAALCLSALLCVLMLVGVGEEEAESEKTRYSFADVLGASSFSETSVYAAERDYVLEVLERIETLTQWCEQWERGNRFPISQSGERPTDYYGAFWSIEGIFKDLRDTITMLNMRPGVYYYCYVAGYDIIYSNPVNVEVERITELAHVHYPSSSGNRIMAFTDSFIAEMDADFEQFRSEMHGSYEAIAALSLISALCAIYLLYAAGRKTADERVFLNFVDKLFTELNVIFIVILFNLGMHVSWVFRTTSGPNELWYLMTFGLFAALVTAAGALALSLVRQGKNGTLWKHTLVYLVFIHTAKFLEEAFSVSELHMRQIISLTVFLGALTMIPFAGFVTVPIMVWSLTKGLRTLVRKQEDELTEEVNRRMRAEHLRSELISNVSHDIRTPLTSVITYIGLLKKENIENERAAGYIEVIEGKAQRLKLLTEDLFEASKATSGDVPVTLENLDFNALIAQGLGELDTKIRESGLDFRVSYQNETETVVADGRLLWRVVENLLQNVFKYALPGSRVYIDVTGEEKSALLSVKNISAQELNVSAVELLERFKRGDEARATSGSGLGLAIAKSLTDAMGGKFEVAIDGDLFKASVELPRSLMTVLD